MSIRRTPGSSIYGPQRESWIAMPRGYIDGLTMSVENSQDINIAAGVCRDSTNSVNMEITDLTKQIDATWAVGDDAGGLNATDYAAGTSGTEPATWYHVFVIRSSIGVVDAGFDKDVSATNLLADSGYTHYRRIGSVLTDSAGPPEAITSFQQRGDYFMWLVPTLDWDSADNLDNAEASPTVKTPLGVKTLAVMNVYCDHSANPRSVWVYSDYHTSAVPSATAAPLTNIIAEVNGVGQAGQMTIETDTASTIRARASDTNANVLIATVAWIDPRGKDA